MKKKLGFLLALVMLGLSFSASAQHRKHYYYKNHKKYYYTTRYSPAKRAYVRVYHPYVPVPPAPKVAYLPPPPRPVILVPPRPPLPRIRH